MTNYYKNEADYTARIITYWIATSLLPFELLYGATWDLNILNKGYVAEVMANLGYPSYLPLILGTSKFLAAICLLVPRLPIVKEWVYSGLMVMFLGPVCSHIIIGYSISTIIFLLVCIGLTITSYYFRPNARKP